MMTPNRTQAPPQTHFAEQFHGSLRDRFLGGLVALEGPSWQTVFLQPRGTVTVLGSETPHTVEGPAVLWQPRAPGQRIRVRAGTSGASLLIGEVALTNAIGHKPEAAALRIMASAAFVVPLRDADLRGDVQRCFDLIQRETSSAAPGADTMIEAQLRVLLVHLWRHRGARDLEDGSAGGQLLLHRFRHVLELHFRDRWGVTQYAKALGVSSDRLHDLCTRLLGRPPLRLIHERQVREAQVLLARAPMTLDQIADHLGFRSAAQFSTFFKGIVGLPPGAYRRRLREDNHPRGSHSPEIRSFADWP